jgi:hypothetical protein
MSRFALLSAVLFLLLAACAPAHAQSIVRLDPGVTNTLERSNAVDYSLNLAQEQYFLYVPKSYSGKQPFGLVVYISPTDGAGLPTGWSDVLDRRHLLYIAPFGAGNSCMQKRRTGLGVLGTLAMMKTYKIDPSRVYAAGLSGGARSASDLGFHQPDLFSGTIQDCGSNFYRAVPQVLATNMTDTNGYSYGVRRVPANKLQEAKAKVRFVLITGPNDFRHGNLTDIFNGGFKPEGFLAKLIDVPGMGHQDCSGETLDQALNFIEGKNK